MGRVEEQQETIGFVSRNSDIDGDSDRDRDSDSESDSDSECEACRYAISGVGGMEDYYSHMQVSGRSRPVILF
jgi:hypothetical protein